MSWPEAGGSITWPPKPSKDAAPEPGVWIAYHSDWSGFVPFATEIDALRYAVDHAMSVQYRVYGSDS